ncbi:MAG: hypothetical protein WD512_02200 [Candidatus Paceibacterota bacterium]
MKIQYYLFFLIFLIPLISYSVSALDTYKFGEDINLKHSVRVDGALVPNLNCNLTVFNPDKSILVDFKEMTDQGNYFNYTINSSDILIKGQYNYDVTCSNGTLSSTDPFSFFVNLGGIYPSAERTATLTRTMAVFFILGILCFIALFFVRAFPFKASLFMGFLWFLIMGINISFISIQDEVINSSIEEFMSFFLVISLKLSHYILYVLSIMWIIVLFVNLFQNKRRKRNERFA